MYAETHTHKRIDKSAKKCTQNIFVRMLQQHVLWNTLEAEHSSLVGWESWWKRWQKQRKAKQINDIAPKREKKYVQKNMIDSGWQCWWGQYEMRANVREGDNLVPKHFFLILILLWELLPSTERGGVATVFVCLLWARVRSLWHTHSHNMCILFTSRVKVCFPFMSSNLFCCLPNWYHCFLFLFHFFAALLAHPFLSYFSLALPPSPPTKKKRENFALNDVGMLIVCPFSILEAVLDFVGSIFRSRHFSFPFLFLWDGTHSPDWKRSETTKHETAWLRCAKYAPCTHTPNGTVNLFVCFHFLFSNEMKKFESHFSPFAHSNGRTHWSTNITELSVQ